MNEALRNVDRRDREWYEKGWRYSRTGTGDLEHGDRRGYPSAWEDGYLDYAAGREKWHLLTCTGCPEHPMT